MVTPRRPCLELLPIRQPDGGSREVHDNFEQVKEWASEKCEELANHEERITALEQEEPIAPGVAIEDEGSPLGDATVLDFVGAGVTATMGGGTATITIPGGGGGLSHGEVVLRSMLLG